MRPGSRAPDGRFDTLDHIDAYVNERLALLASAKHGRTGRNWATRFNHEWCTQLGVYRLSGQVTRWPAHASR